MRAGLFPYENRPLIPDHQPGRVVQFCPTEAETKLQRLDGTQGGDLLFACNHYPIDLGSRRTNMMSDPSTSGEEKKRVRTSTSVRFL